MSVFPLDLNAMYFFTRVIEHKGFTAAGKALGIPTSRLSRRVAQLNANSTCGCCKEPRGVSNSPTSATRSISTASQ